MTSGIRTDIVMILDRSGSMDQIADDVVGGVSRFIEEQKVVPGEAAFTLVQFDDRYEVVYDAVPIARVAALTRQTFVPRGSTALLDAIGRTIDDLGTRLSALPQSHRPGKVIVVIVTDGHENASQRFTRQDVFGKISHQRDIYGWEFSFLAAGQDAILEAQQIGIPAAAAMTFTASPQGVGATYRSISRGVNAMRSGTAMTMSFSDEDRIKAADADARVDDTTVTSSSNNS